MKNVWIKALVILFALGCNLKAAAQEKAFSGSSALSDEQIEQRIQFITQRLDAHKQHGQIWFWSWMTVNGGSAIGLGVAAGLSDKGSDRVNFASQGALATLGVGDLLFRPLEARYGADPIRRIPEGTRHEKLVKLRAAEDLLHANAERAAERHNWIVHLTNVLLNAAAGAATGLAGDATSGAINAGLGALTGELYILTQPGGPEKDWGQYKAMISNQTTGIHLTVDPFPLGLMFRVTW